MDWLQARFVVRAEDAEAVSDALLAAGALSVDAGDAGAGTDAETPIYGEPGSAPGPWPLTAIGALFNDGTDVPAAVADACQAAGFAPSGLHVERVPERDWVRLTQSQFEPLRISDRLWVVPSWHTPPDGSAVCLHMDPGLAFGTGSHPTTRLCLQWLDANLSTGASVLDYGCGSGILAIAAARLGAQRVVGVDIDPQAVTASRENAERNGVAAEFGPPECVAGRTFGVVVANILANPLRVLAPLLCGACETGGRLVMSGVLAAQAEDVMRAYAPWIRFRAPLEEEDWVALVGERRATVA